MIKRKIRITEDGSTTLELIGMDENFHSTHGAIQESEHIFIQNGLLEKAKGQKHIRIFEMGFGTGLNALLTILKSSRNDLVIDYLGIEAYPVEKELVEELNYSEMLNLNGVEANYLRLLHTTAWDIKTALFPGFHFEKRKARLEEIELAEDRFDLVYFDAFNPDLQAELWTEDIFREIYLAMKHTGVLMTYSAKGKVKRALKAAGFILYALPGPPGKREITQAVKI